MDERALLSRARKLDPETLEQIHNLYYKPIFSYVSYRVSDRYVAEDLTSEVFIRLLDALHKRMAPKTSLRAWLYRVAANVVSDHYRAQYRIQQVELDESLPATANGPDKVAETAFASEELRQALSELTEDQQNVIALRFGVEMPIREVARTLGKTEGAIKQLQARALAALAQRVEDREASDEN